MRTLGLLAAVGFIALAPSLARADAAYTPCCQDTVKLFQQGAETFWKPPTMVPYAAPAAASYSAPAACCQDTLKLFWLGADTWNAPNTSKK
jgi:hypothetical protein